MPHIYIISRVMWAHSFNTVVVTNPAHIVRGYDGSCQHQKPKEINQPSVRTDDDYFLSDSHILSSSKNSKT